MSKPTKKEQYRIDRMLALGCVACAYLNIVNLGTDIHHLLDGHVRMGWTYTICLCPGHHRSTWSPEQVILIPKHLRVSIADGRKAFTAVYPTERDLWITVQRRLHLPQTWPVSKILPRRAS
jgi:Recombination enhancement, RecA-dependent nuclease